MAVKHPAQLRARGKAPAEGPGSIGSDTGIFRYAAMLTRLCGAAALGLAFAPCLAAEGGATPRFWAEAEYLRWWTKERDLPVLVTTSPAGTPLPQTGVLGQPNTQILFGGNAIGNDSRDGARFSVGAWLIPDSLGIGLRYFQLREGREGFAADSNTTATLARPFFNTLTSAQDSALVALPGFLSGRVDASATLDVSGGEIYGRKRLYRDGSRDLDLTLGLMQTKVNDEVTVVSNSLALPGPLSVGVADRFRTENDFLGISIGASGSVRHERWSLSGLVKVAYGKMEQTVKIAGSTTFAGPGTAITTPGGVLAQPSNMGEHSRDRMAFVPEIGLNARYALAHGISLVAGYSAIFWSHVALAGNQIDTNVDFSQITQNPRFRFQDSHFWAHGLNLGLQVEW